MCYNNKVQNAVELYTNGFIDIDTMYGLGARYYGDLNSDKATNVNDVTSLQMYLNGSLFVEEDSIFDENRYKIYCDLKMCIRDRGNTVCKRFAGRA